MEEDAQRALKEIKEFEGQRLCVSLAKKKVKEKKKAGLCEDQLEVSHPVSTHNHHHVTLFSTQRDRFHRGGKRAQVKRPQEEEPESSTHHQESQF